MHGVAINLIGPHRFSPECRRVSFGDICLWHATIRPRYPINENKRVG